MNELAWLDFYHGQWHLATSDTGSPLRKWMDRKAALSDLTSEGWTTVDPLPKQVPDIDPKSPALRLTLVRKWINRLPG